MRNTLTTIMVQVAAITNAMKLECDCDPVVKLYQHHDCNEEEVGWVVELDVNVAEWNYSDDGGWPNDDASSIRVPEGYTVELYKNVDLVGFLANAFELFPEDGEMACLNFRYTY